MQCPEIECQRNMERTEDGRLWVCTSCGAAVNDLRVASRRQHNLDQVRRVRATLEAKTAQPLRPLHRVA